MNMSRTLIGIVLVAAPVAVWSQGDGDRDDHNHHGAAVENNGAQERNGGHDHGGMGRDRGEGDAKGDHEGGEGMKGMGRGGMRGMMGKPGHDMAMHEKWMKVREAERKVRDAAEKMRAAEGAEKAAAKSEVRKLLGELLDAKLAAEEALLKKTEKQAAELKAKIAKKKAERGQMINARLERLSGEADDWE